MASPLVLSLFPGIGLLDRAFEEEGFCVVRGPDILWGGDVKAFHPPTGRFDGVIGGPPCQAFSTLNRINSSMGNKIAENLIPEYERVVGEAQPHWFLMENVPNAPEPQVNGYQVHSFLLNNRWLGEEQNRARRWSFGTASGIKIWPETVALEHPRFEHAVTAGVGGRRRGVPERKEYSRKYGGGMIRKGRKFRERCRLQGLPDSFDIPPFTIEAKCKAVGNGVPLAMGRAMAKAVKEATGGF